MTTNRIMEQTSTPNHGHANCGFDPTAAAARDREQRNYRLHHFATIRAKAAGDLAAVEEAKAEAVAIAEAAAEAGKRLGDAIQAAKQSNHEFTQATQAAREEGRPIDVEEHVKRAAGLLG